MSNTNSSMSTGSTTLAPAGTASEYQTLHAQQHSKVVLCGKCEVPMKMRRLSNEEHFFECTICESVRDPFDDEVDLAVTVREKPWLDSLFSSSR